MKVFAITATWLTCNVIWASVIAKDSFTGQLWLSTSDGNFKLSQQEDIKFKSHCDSAKFVIDVDDTVNKGQTIRGFGASMSRNAVKAISELMPKIRQKKIFKEIFDPEKGLKLNVLRIVLGPTEKENETTYDDTCCTLNDFSVERDQEDLIPLLKMIIEINPDVSIVGTFYTPPTWMKTKDTLDGGMLDPQRVKDFALYVALTVEAYAEAGINFTAVSIQNSPSKVNPERAGMLLSAEKEAAIVKDNFKWSFEQFALTTKILLGEVDWEDEDYAMEAMKGSKHNDLVMGVAFHCARGSASSQEKVHVKNKDKEIWLTECFDADLTKSTSYAKLFPLAVRDIMIGGFRNWANVIVKYDLDVDKRNDILMRTLKDPEKLETSDGSEPQTSEFYSMAHFSKFVKRGAKRIQSTSHPKMLETVAFKNPGDGEVILVVVNYNKEEEVKVRIKFGLDSFDYFQPQMSVITVSWVPINDTRKLDAYSQIEAESFSQRSGVKNVLCQDTTGCGSSVVESKDDEKHFTIFNDVNFEPSHATHLEARVSAKDESVLEFRIDDLEGKLLAKLNAKQSAKFQLVSSEVRDAEGLHDLFVVFKTGKPQLNWFRFIRKLDIEEGKWYKIISKNSQFSFDVQHKQTTPGTPLLQWPYFDGANQQFTFKAVKGTFNGYHISDSNSKKCLEANYEKKIVALGECGNKEQQTWILNLHPNNFNEDGQVLYNIVTKDSQYGVFASQEKGSNIKIIDYSCDRESQLFELIGIGG